MILLSHKLLKKSYTYKSQNFEHLGGTFAALYCLKDFLADWNIKQKGLSELILGSNNLRTIQSNIYNNRVIWIKDVQDTYIGYSYSIDFQTGFFETFNNFNKKLIDKQDPLKYIYCLPNIDYFPSDMNLVVIDSYDIEYSESFNSCPYKLQYGDDEL